MEISLGTFTFPSKKAVKEHCRNIIKSFNDGEIISGTADSFLRELVKFHPESTIKIGDGINHFTIATDTEWGNSRHFMICRVDGSQTDVSFHSCLDGNNPNQDRLNALRHAIIPQIIQFKEYCFKNTNSPVCPYKMISLTRESCHVHHEPPSFRMMVDGWLEQNQISLSDVEISTGWDLQYTSIMTFGNQIRSWTDYHKEHAHLCLISKLAHQEICTYNQSNRMGKD